MMMSSRRPSHCSWRGKVADYQAHLTECLFEPHSCKHCSAMVAKRDDAAHAAVCTVKCPFPGCDHKCPRVDMAAHHMNAADAHARAATAEISALKESSAAATRRIKDLEDLGKWTVVNVDFRLKADACFTVPEFEMGGACSQWFPVWGGLSIRFRWLAYPPDERATCGLAPHECYCLMTDVTENASDGLEMYGSLAACYPQGNIRWSFASVDAPVKFSSEESYSSSSVSMTDSAADSEKRAKIMQSDGTIRFKGRYRFREQWRADYLP